MLTSTLFNKVYTHVPGPVTTSRQPGRIPHLRTDTPEILRSCGGNGADIDSTNEASVCGCPAKNV